MDCFPGASRTHNLRAAVLDISRYSPSLSPLVSFQRSPKPTNQPTRCWSDRPVNDPSQRPIAVPPTPERTPASRLFTDIVIKCSMKSRVPRHNILRVPPPPSLFYQGNEGVRYRRGRILSSPSRFFVSTVANYNVLSDSLDTAL